MDTRIDRSYLLGMLDKLLLAHAPPGSEAEVDAIVMEAVKPFADRVWQDASGGIVVHVAGADSSAPIAVTAHKDEIGLIVKRVEADGRLRVRPLGGLHPWAVGEGPVDILGRKGILPGVLSIGSKHVSEESPAGELKQGKPLKWEMMWVETKLPAETLKQAGVHPGTKVAVGRARKAPMVLNDFICGPNLDCRAGLAILIETAKQLKASPPAQDVYLIATSEEEIGAQGAVYSVGKVPAETVIALDIAPVAEEYQTRNSAEPVLLYGDATGVYHEGANGHLEGLAAEMGFGVQRAVVTSYGSDASIARKAGVAGRSVCIGYPGENTHGYEICAVDGILNSARLLLAYLQKPL